MLTDVSGFSESKLSFITLIFYHLKGEVNGHIWETCQIKQIVYTWEIVSTQIYKWTWQEDMHCKRA